MVLGRVLGHDVDGKGGFRGQSPPPTLSRPRRPEEEVQFNLSLLRHSSHRHGSLEQQEEEEEDGEDRAGQKQTVELGLVGLPRWRRLGFNCPLQRLSRRRGGAASRTEEEES